MIRATSTILTACLTMLVLTSVASASPINLLLSSNGGVADINGASAGGYGTVAANLIDGNTDGNYGDGSIGHSISGQAGNYMEVKTPEVDNFLNIQVFNRTDCCNTRIDGNGAVPYTVTIFNGVTPVFTENLTFVPTPSLVGPNESGQQINLPAGIYGNLVQITQNNNDYMNLAEIKGIGYVTPEPSSIVLCTLGAVGLLVAARRRRMA